MNAFHEATGISWFQVAEYNYDSFMIRHMQLADRDRIERNDPGAAGSGVVFLVSWRGTLLISAAYLKSSGGGSSICGTSILTLLGSIPVPTPL